MLRIGAFFMIIGICGFIGSGKNTAAEYFIEQGFEQYSFAGTLKDAVAAVFGWDRELLEGLTEEARIWREQVDPWWAERLGMSNLTPRWVLQQWGTEVCRVGFHDDIWIASLENKLRTAPGNVVISDCRFPNEIKAIKQAGGKVIWVQRGELPNWYSVAILDNNTTGHYARDNMDKKQVGMKYQFPDVHASEWAWVGTKFDLEIENNGTVEELFAQLKNLV